MTNELKTFGEMCIEKGIETGRVRIIDGFIKIMQEIKDIEEPLLSDVSEKIGNLLMNKLA